MGWVVGEGNGKEGKDSSLASERGWGGGKEVALRDLCIVLVRTIIFLERSKHCYVF